MNNYHDQLDAFEARVRAEQEETDIHNADKEEKCCCYEYVGDNSGCPVHGTHADEDDDGSDTSMATQLQDAGFGSVGAL